MKNILSVVSLSFFLPFFFCCITDMIVAVSPDVWGFPKDRLMRESGSEKALLTDTDFSAFEKSGLIKEVEKLGPGGAFYFSFRFDTSTKKGEENRDLFLRYSAQYEELPWRRESLGILLDEAEKTGSELKPEKIALLIELYGGFLKDYPQETGIREQGLSLLYFAKEYSLLRDNYLYLENFAEKYTEPEREGKANDEDSYRLSDKAKALQALAFIASGDNTKGTTALRDLLFSGKPSPLFSEILQQLAELNKTEILSPEELNYLKGKILLSEKKYIPAFPLMDPMVNNSSLWLRYPQMLYDIRLLYHFRSDKTEKAEELLAFSQIDDTAERYPAAFYAGRIFRRANRYDRAEAAFLRGYKIASNRSNSALKDFEKDEACWYYLWTVLDTSSERFTGELAKYASEWEDPEFYNDLLERFAKGELAKATKGGDLSGLFAVLEKDGRFFPLDSYIYFSWLCYLDFNKRNFRPDEQKRLLFDIASKDPLGYEGLIAESLTGGNFDFLPKRPPGKIKAPGIINKKRNLRDDYSAEGDADRVAVGFLDFNLFLEAYYYALENVDNLSYRTVREISYALSREGIDYATISLLSKVCYNNDFNMSFSDLAVLFPVPYEKEVKAAARRFDIDMWFLYSVIRTESAFAPSAGSHAGARGLLQLMPATAEERASELGMEDFDLRKPADNIILGASHFRWLFNRDWIGNNIDALMAYNAGGGNLRRWHRELEGDNNYLFTESIDFPETRGYVRRAFYSLMLYHYIYNGDLPSKTLENYL